MNASAAWLKQELVNGSARGTGNLDGRYRPQTSQQTFSFTLEGHTNRLIALATFELKRNFKFH